MSSSYYEVLRGYVFCIPYIEPSPAEIRCGKGFLIFWRGEENPKTRFFEALPPPCLSMAEPFHLRGPKPPQ